MGQSPVQQFAIQLVSQKLSFFALLFSPFIVVAEPSVAVSHSGNQSTASLRPGVGLGVLIERKIETFKKEKNVVSILFFGPVSVWGHEVRVHH